MDPLSNASAATALKLRLLQASSPALAIMLEDGLVIAGEVIEVSSGSAFLSLGGRRVPADTGVELQPGQRFSARVHRDGDNIVLRLLDPEVDDAKPLVTALRAVLAENRPAATLLSRLATELRAHAEVLDPKERARVEVLAKVLESFVHVPEGEGQLLKSALLRSGVFHEALLARGREGVADALHDLKTVLLRALAEAPEGPERESVQRALAGLEAEQLLDVARSRAGDARHFGLAVPDGQNFATAHLLVQRDLEREHSDEAPTNTESSGPVAVDLAVSLSNLGPVRAEFRLDRGALAVRFVVSSPDVAARMNADHDVLANELALDGRTPRLQVVVAAPDEVMCDPGLEGVSFLRDHLLLDLVG